MKKLYRSNNKVWKGILGGFGEYFNIDPVILRVVFVFFVLATGFIPALVTYLISLVIIPKKPTIQESKVL